LCDIENVAIDSHDFVDVVKALGSELGPYMENERECIEMLDDSLGASKSRRLALRFERGKEFVPIQEHPKALRLLRARQTENLQLQPRCAVNGSFSDSGAVVEEWADRLDLGDLDGRRPCSR
jgi:hypothetical protein